MKLKYIGTDGSMGYKTGEIYDVSIKTSEQYILLCCIGHKICPYSSLNALLKNWQEPVINEYPIVIIGENVIEVQKLCREFAEQNRINGIKKKGRAEWKINSNGKEYWIMHRSHYEEWCQGRTYYKDGILMHSGYELKE